MSGLQQRAQMAAAEVALPPDDTQEDRKVRRDIALHFMEELYPELCMATNTPLNKAAQEALAKGKIQFWYLGLERMEERLGVIDRMIGQSEGATNEEKATALFCEKKVYGVRAVELYAMLKGMGEAARAAQIQQHADHAADQAVMDGILLRDGKLSKKQRKWLRQKRNAF